MKHKLGAASLAALAWLLSCGSAQAVQVVPIAYDMPNGYTGNYQYWDDLYTGTGCKTCNGAPLSGGLGDLTDGVIATTNWDVAEAPAGPGPYVAWVGINPTIRFEFGSTVAIDSATIYFDDASNNGVAPPLQVIINGQNFAVPNPPANVPFAFTASSLSFLGTTLDMTFIRNTSWTFASEVRFDVTTPVPELATLPMLAGGAVFVALAVRRRRLCAQRGS